MGLSAAQHEAMWFVVIHISRGCWITRQAAAHADLCVGVCVCAGPALSQLTTTLGVALVGRGRCRRQQNLAHVLYRAATCECIPNRSMFPVCKALMLREAVGLVHGLSQLRCDAPAAWHAVCAVTAHSL